MERTCKKCGETKPIEEFPKSKSTAGGHEFTCKRCSNKQKNKNLMAKYRSDQTFKEHRKELAKNYKRDHPDRESYLSKKRIYYYCNQIHENDRSKSYRKKHKEQYGVYKLNNEIKSRAKLTGRYIVRIIRQNFNLPSESIRSQPELIEKYRELIISKRQKKSMKNEKIIVCKQ